MLRYSDTSYYVIRPYTEHGFILRRGFTLYSSTLAQWGLRISHVLQRFVNIVQRACFIAVFAVIVSKRYCYSTFTNVVCNLNIKVIWTLRHRVSNRRRRPLNWEANTTHTIVEDIRILVVPLASICNTTRTLRLSINLILMFSQNCQILRRWDEDYNCLWNK